MIADVFPEAPVSLLFVQRLLLREDRVVDLRVHLGVDELLVVTWFDVACGP
jgi:hypothetical protein